MARKPGSDERQTDFFGAPVVTPEKTRNTPAPKPAPSLALPKPAAVTPISAKAEPGPAVTNLDIPEADDIEAELARMSPAEVRTLVATLPDAVLAQLTLATIRQLRRRLERNSRHAGGKTSNTVLDRAAQQLIAELGGQNDEYDF